MKKYRTSRLLWAMFVGITIITPRKSTSLDEKVEDGLVFGARDPFKALFTSDPQEVTCNLHEQLDLKAFMEDKRIGFFSKCLPDASHHIPDNITTPQSRGDELVIHSLYKS